MAKLSHRKVMYILLFLYMYFLSFLNFTPVYLTVAIGLILIVAMQVLRLRKIVLTNYFYFECIFIFYNLCYVVLGKTISADETISMLQTLVLNLAISVAIMNTISNKKDLERVVKWFVPIAIFSGVFAIVYSGGTGIDGRLAHGVQRLFFADASTYTSMEFASWALYASTFALVEFLRTRRKRWLIPMPLFWIVILWSGSRKWLVFGVILELLVYYSCTRKVGVVTQLKKILFVLGILGILLVVVFKVPAAYEVIGYRIEGFISGVESSAVTRDSMMQTAFVYIRENPMFGYGLNTFRTISVYETWSESNMLEMLFSGGIVLFLYYYGYMIYLICSLLKIKNKDLIHKVFILIMVLLVVFDCISMSYQGRLESMLITFASLLVYFENKRQRMET